MWLPSLPDECLVYKKGDIFGGHPRAPGRRLRLLHLLFPNRSLDQLWGDCPFEDLVSPYLRFRRMVQAVYACIAVLSRLLRMLSSFVGSPMKSSEAFQKAVSIAVGIKSS